jgi:hypothetical protein
MKNEIVVGLNDSPSGKAALTWAAEQARSTGSVLRSLACARLAAAACMSIAADHELGRWPVL